MLKAVCTLVATLLLLATTTVPAARADWMNLTGAETAPNIAEITVLDDRVRVVLEVYIGDLATFEALLPDDWLNKDVADRPSLAERLRRFSEETFQVVTDDGRQLQADLKLAEPRQRKERASAFAGMINPTTRQRVPGPPEDKRVIYAELDYPFSGRPRHLTFVPPRNADGGVAATVGFIAYHKAVPIIDFRYLSGPAKLSLDWDDPWYTKFDNPNLKRHHKSALMSFLYVEPREVRHEVLIRLRDLQDWTDLGLGDSATILPAEQEAIKQRARAFLATRNPLEVDGRPALPDSSRAEFLKVALTGLQVVEADKAIDLSTAILGVILSYPVKQLPGHVIVHWDLFNDRVEQVPVTATDPAGPLRSLVTADDPMIEWQNYLRKYQDPKVSPVVLDDGRSIGVPLLSVLFLIVTLGAAALAVRPALLSRRLWVAVAGSSAVVAVLLLRVAVVDVANPFAGPPGEEAAAQIVTGVLNSLNSAYVEQDPAALRQALGIVVASDALADVEVELGRALAINVVGGGIARIDAVEDLQLKETTTLEGRPGFRSLVEWTVQANAGHWGHAHRRRIRFRALIELVEQDGTWVLAGITVVDAEQQS